jgi:L-lactate dehydrogenase complex protein LldF
MSIRVGAAAQAPPFPTAAKSAIEDTQLRQNVRHATDVIRAKRAMLVAEKQDWQQLRTAASRIKEHTMRHLGSYLVQFEESCVRAGGKVYWAADADEANRMITGIIQSHGVTEVIKVKTMTSDETQLNAALESSGITPYETDLADLIVQLGADHPSHIVVPALHKNRMQIRRIFLEKMHLETLGHEPKDLAEAARRYLREKFLRVPIGISGANFAIAENGSVCIVESEGNARMCLTLPKVLISLIGIEKVIPRFRDLEVFLQILARSATGERMSPYSSIWSGVSNDDGPREFHVVLLDNGRTKVLSDETARQTLHCIRCGACLNACPVYRQTGGHAYGSIYSGPIGAILTPQLQSMQHSQTLPFASSLCGACYEVCPVKINIPEVLVHLRGKVVDQGDSPVAEKVAMKTAAFALAGPKRLEAAQTFARLAQTPFLSDGVMKSLPGMLAGWSSVRDLMPVPSQSFRDWWRQRK